MSESQTQILTRVYDFQNWGVDASRRDDFEEAGRQFNRASETLQELPDITDQDGRPIKNAVWAIVKAAIGRDMSILDLRQARRTPDTTWQWHSLKDAQRLIDISLGLLEGSKNDIPQQEFAAQYGATLNVNARLAGLQSVLTPDPEKQALLQEKASNLFATAERHLAQGNNPFWRANNLATHGRHERAAGHLRKAIRLLGAAATTKGVWPILRQMPQETFLSIAAVSTRAWQSRTQAAAAKSITQKAFPNV